MKIQHYFVIVVLSFFLILPFNLLAQEKEIPITTSSKEALKLFLEGLDKFENFETNSAISLFDQAIQKDPNFAIAYLYRAFSGGGREILRKNLKKAVSLLDKVSEGEKYWILFSKASADRQGSYQKKHITKLLELYPSDKRVQYLAGEYYRYLEDNTKAFKHFNRATELDTNYAAPYNDMGYIYISLGNYEAAENAFKTYIKLRPDSPNPYDSYAELLLKMERYNDSIEQYQEALKRGMDNSLVGIGWNHVFKENYAKAREYYQMYYDKTSRIDEKLRMIRLKASSYATEGKIEDAVKLFEDYRVLAKKEDINTNVILSYAYQGALLTEFGDPVGGMKKYEKAIGLVKTLDLPEEEKENYKVNSIIWRCYALTSNNKFNETEVEIRKAKSMIEKRKHPAEERDFHAMIAFLEYKKGNYDKALEHFSKSSQTNPWNIYYIAMTYISKGEKEKARNLLEKLKNWNLNVFAYSLVRNRAMEDLEKL